MLISEYIEILNGINNMVDSIFVDIGLFNVEVNFVYRMIRNDLLWIKCEFG